MRRKSINFEDQGGNDLINDPKGSKKPTNRSNPNTNNNNNFSSKKQIDHSNYWKIVVQEFAKKLDDSDREKDIHKEQAIGY